MDEYNRDYSKDCYNISNYDIVYIILKPFDYSNEAYKECVKHDKKRDKWFLTGRVIEAEGYPKYHTITFVPENHIIPFLKAKKFIEKKQYVLNIQFGDIDYITLPFDSFDWKR